METTFRTEGDLLSPQSVTLSLMVIASRETPTKYGKPGKYALYYAFETTGTACLADDHLDG